MRGGFPLDLESEPVDVDPLAVDEGSSELLAAAEEFDAWILSRGWTYDEDNSVDRVATWVYEPSAAEFDDDGEAEPVTRVWIAVVGDGTTSRFRSTRHWSVLATTDAGLPGKPPF